MVMVRGSTTIQEYAGGPKRVRAGLFKPKGTTGPAKATQEFAAVGALYDLGNSAWARGNVEYGSIASSTTADAAVRSTGVIPCISSGTPQYPFSVVVWTNVLATSTNNDTLLQFTNSGDSSQSLNMRCNGSAFMQATSNDGSGAAGGALTAASTASTNVCYIAVFTSTTSRSIYGSVDTTGATNTATRTPTGLDTLTIANTSALDRQWGPNALVNYVAVLPYDLSVSSTARDAIFAGADPVRVCGFAHGRVRRASDGAQGAVYRFPAGSMLDYSGNGLDLTETGTLTKGSQLLVVRDISGNNRHVKATTSSPTFSSSQGNGQGGGAFTTSTFMVYDGTVPDVAPLQVYLAGRSASTTADQTAFWLGDKDAATSQWYLQMAGAQTGDPVWWNAQAGGAAAISATSVGFSADTDYVMWGLEASSTSRAAQINGGSQGTNTTSTSPAGADRIGLGSRQDSTPSDFLNGQIHYVILQTTASTHDKTRIEKFLARTFGIAI